MPELSITDYHAMCRDAIAKTLADLGVGVAVSRVDAPDDMFTLELPCIGVACVGPEQERGDFSTNLSDGISFGVAVALVSRGVTRGEKTPEVLTATKFRRLLHTTFHKKRLAGVPQVGYCEVSDSGEIWDERNPKFQVLQTAMVVSAIGRFPRS